MYTEHNYVSFIAYHTRLVFSEKTFFVFLLMGLRIGQIPIYNGKQKAFHCVAKEILSLFSTKSFLFLGSSKFFFSQKIYSVYRFKNVIAKDMSSTAKKYNVKGYFGAQSFTSGYEEKIFAICNVDEAEILMNKGSGNNL